MGLPELRADVKLLRDQYAQGTDALDLRRELSENLLPLLTSILEGIAEEHGKLADEVVDLGEAVDDMMDDTGDVLHPETTTKIVGLIEAGKLLANELGALLPKLDDVAKRRVAQIVKTYKQGAEVVLAMLVEITMPVDAEDVAAQAGDDDEEGDDDLEDDEEGEDEEGEDEDEEGDDDADDEGTITGGV